ncbi:RTA1-domain-containing protein [Clavulina sp. PMI_390]|nr:RTA1-domain-containing protein [Clavulina sp. PMI_390]
MSNNSSNFDPNGHYHYKGSDGVPNRGPTFWIAVMFTTLFAISTAIHFLQAIIKRRWYLLATAVMCGIGETVGWVGRSLSAKNPLADNPFLMQITCTIIAPTFLTAANFICLAQLIKQADLERYSRLSARTYSWLFITVDFTALVIQAFGGAMASGSQPTTGGNVMLVGIIISLVGMLIYAALGLNILSNMKHNKAVRGAAGYDGKRPELSHRHRLMVYGLEFSTVVLLIRGLYRTVELSAGWNGVIIRTEVLFNLFDGAMIVLAMYTLNFFHPGWLLDESRQHEPYGEWIGLRTASPSPQPSLYGEP